MRIGLQILAIILLVPLQLVICLVIFGANKDSLPLWFVQSASPWLLMLALTVPLITAVCAQPLAGVLARPAAWLLGSVILAITFAILAPGASMMARNGIVEMFSRQSLDQLAWALVYILTLFFVPAVLGFLATWKLLKRASERRISN